MMFFGKNRGLPADIQFIITQFAQYYKEKFFFCPSGSRSMKGISPHPSSLSLGHLPPRGKVYAGGQKKNHPADAGWFKKAA